MEGDRELVTVWEMKTGNVRQSGDILEEEWVVSLGTTTHTEMRVWRWPEHRLTPDSDEFIF